MQSSYSVRIPTIVYLSRKLKLNFKFFQKLVGWVCQKQQSRTSTIQNSDIKRISIFIFKIKYTYILNDLCITFKICLTKFQCINLVPDKIVSLISNSNILITAFHYNEYWNIFRMCCILDLFSLSTIVLCLSACWLYY